MCDENDRNLRLQSRNPSSFSKIVPEGLNSIESIILKSNNHQIISILSIFPKIMDYNNISPHSDEGVINKIIPKCPQPAHLCEVTQPKIMK